MYKHPGLTTAIALSLLCSSCYVDRALVSPYKSAPKTSRSSWIATADAKQKPVRVPTTFPIKDTPVTLSELIDVALSNNTQTQTTWAQARQAASQYGQTQSQYFPTVTGEYSYTRLRTLVGPAIDSPTPSILYLSEWSPQLSLAYTIYDFGLRTANTEAAHQALFFADWTHNREVQTVIQTISTDFYNYLLQRQLLRSYEMNLETARVTLEAADLGLITGVRDLSDVLQAQTKLYEVEISLVNQQYNVQNSLAQLLLDMGLPANHELLVHDFPIIRPEDSMLKDVDALLAIAVQSRADLLAAEANLQSKEQSVLAAERAGWPTITYNFSYGKTNYHSQLGNFDDGHDFNGVLSFSIPLFAGFYYKNGVKIAQANREQADAQLRQSLLEVIRDVTVSHFNVKVTFEGLQYANKYLLSAAEEYNVILSQYRAGVNTITNVLSAQSSLADARSKEATGIKDWFNALVNLNYATGILTSSLIKEDSPMIPDEERILQREETP